MSLVSTKGGRRSLLHLTLYNTLLVFSDEVHFSFHRKQENRKQAQKFNSILTVLKFYDIENLLPVFRIIGQNCVTKFNIDLLLSVCVIPIHSCKGLLSTTYRVMLIRLYCAAMKQA